jgi:putative restriction endonuclease
VGSYQELLARVRRYRRGGTELAIDPVIGCNVLANPFFLPENEWIPVPTNWAANIVQGKTYNSEDAEGRNLLQALQRTLTQGPGKDGPDDGFVVADAERYGSEYLTRGRLGQGAFRVLVTDAYDRRCAVTGEKTLPVLEAAHIKPYALHGPHLVRNGLLLRSDLHKLFDLGYVTVTPELRFEVSPRLREEWHNGKEYYAYHGHGLHFLPTEAGNFPDREYLTWHNENCFHG